jgi:hypothetical protein
MEPLLHIFIWSIVLFYPYIKYLGREGGYSMEFAHELNSLVFKMTISYFLYLWFFPRKEQLKYIPFVILAFILNTMLYEFFEGYFHPENNHFWKHFVSNMLTYISFGIVFFAIYSVKDLYKKQIVIDALSLEKREAELKALKAQVDPHFLFNTLNTIYANALKKDDKTPDLILKLSDSFRYLLHEGQKTEVFVQQEIQHVRDYINLQQERLFHKVTVDFTSKVDSEIKQISPLLLIGFIENAFKYASILKGENHLIKIKIQLLENELTFECQNPFLENAEEELELGWKKSGVGIKNTQNRLQLLYPEKHQLEIKKEENLFNVLLKIEL